MLRTNPGKVRDLGKAEEPLARFHSDRSIQVPASSGLIYVSQFRGKVLLMNKSDKSPSGFRKDPPFCAKQPRLEGPG